MFISETHLPQLLSGTAYTDPQWFEQEKERVLLPAWHVVTSMAEIPRPGDFITAQVLGYPVIVHNVDGVARAFLNVCPHRYALLTSASRGNACRLKCQYHGWEFDADGRTRRIPDAPSFRPLERGKLGLEAIASGTCGQLVFVRLQTAGLSLEDFLGEHGAVIRERCAVPNRLTCSHARVVDANWKLVVENTLESYHVSEVHRDTIVVMPDEAVCHHDFGGNGSVFTAPGGVPGLLGVLERMLLRSVSKATSQLYRHHLVLPNLSLSVMDDIVIVWTCEPLAADRTRLTLRGFSEQGEKTAALRNALLAWSGRRHLKFWRRVWEEDVRLYPDVQAGASSPVLPGPGLLSRREERVVHFQRWLLDRMGGDAAEPFTKPSSVTQGVSA